MAKEVRSKEEVKEKKCDCGPDCKCGCQEGKECTCGEKGCHCGCSCKRIFVKFIFLALVFFAGMGVNQFMNDACFGRCPGRKIPRPMPMMQMSNINHGNIPAYTDGAGNTIIIVNTGEEVMKHGCKCGSDCKCANNKDGKPCGCHKHGKHHPMKDMPHLGQPNQPNVSKPAE